MAEQTADKVKDKVQATDDGLKAPEPENPFAKIAVDNQERSATTKPKDAEAEKIIVKDQAAPVSAEKAAEGIANSIMSGKSALDKMTLVANKTSGGEGWNEFVSGLKNNPLDSIDFKNGVVKAVRDAYSTGGDKAVNQLIDMANQKVTGPFGPDITIDGKTATLRILEQNPNTKELWDIAKPISFKLEEEKKPVKAEEKSDIIKRPSETPSQIAEEFNAVLAAGGDNSRFKDVHKKISDTLLFAYQDTQGSPEDKQKALKKVANEMDSQMTSPFGVVAEFKNGKLDVSIAEGSLDRSASFPNKHPEGDTFFRDLARTTHDLPKDKGDSERYEKQVKGVMDRVSNLALMDSKDQSPALTKQVQDQIEFMAQRAHLKSGAKGIEELNATMAKVAENGKAPKIVLNSDGKTMNIVGTEKGLPSRNDVPLEAPERKATRAENFDNDDKSIKTVQFPQDILPHVAFSADPEFATLDWRPKNKGEEAVANAIHRNDLAKLVNEIPKGVIQGFAGTVKDVNDDFEKNGMGRPLDEGDPTEKAVGSLFRLKREWNNKAREASKDIEVQDPKTGAKTQHKAFDLDGTTIYKAGGKELLEVYKDKEGFSVMLIPEKELPTGKVGSETAAKLFKEALKSTPVESSATVRLPKVDMDLKEKLDWMNGMSDAPPPGQDPLRLKGVMASKFGMDKDGFDARQLFAASGKRSIDMPPKPVREVNTNFTLVIGYKGQPLMSLPVTSNYFKDPKKGQ